MTTTYSVDAVVPHAASMSLLDEITGFGEEWLSAGVNISAASTFADEQGVPAWIGIEYMAQCIAAFSGVQERTEGGEPKLGFLLGTRRYESPIEYFPLGSRVDLKVVREMQADNGLSAFRCTLRMENVEISSVINVFQPEDADQFLWETTQ